MSPRRQADEWIRRLELQPHPEGGHFRETYRCSAISGGRNLSTAIYFLLAAGEVSRFHRLLSDEIWHYHAGSPLTVHCLLPGGGYRALHLGPREPAEPQQMVPAGWWFGATVDEDAGYTLAGCTVAPGFEFTDFELARREVLLSEYPEQGELIERLT